VSITGRVGIVGVLVVGLALDAIVLVLVAAFTVCLSLFAPLLVVWIVTVLVLVLVVAVVVIVVWVLVLCCTGWWGGFRLLGSLFLASLLLRLSSGCSLSLFLCGWNR
jgi:hypothetical protein